MKYFVRALFYAAVAGVVYVSVLPAESLVETGVWDKLEHAGAYAALTLLGLTAYRSPKQAPLLAAALAALGAGLEVVQTFVPGRVGDPADAAANAAGVVLISLANFVIRNRRTIG